MIKVSIDGRRLSPDTIHIGVDGDNLSERIAFELPEQIADQDTRQFALSISIDGKDTQYMDVISINSDYTAVFTVPNAIAKSGAYKYSLRFVSGDVAYGTVKAIMKVLPHLNVSESIVESTPPDVIDSIQGAIGGLTGRISALEYENIANIAELTESAYSADTAPILKSGTLYCFTSQALEGISFKLPSNPDLGYQSTMTFQTPHDCQPIKLNQSKALWLSGDDCTNGALIPQAGTSYRLDISNFAGRLCGRVTGLGFGKSYTPLPDNPQGAVSAVVAAAKSYYENRDVLTYGTDGTVVSPNFNPSDPLIDCSTFAALVLRGITYQDSKYVDDSNSNLGAAPWAQNDLPRTAADQGRHCVQNGWYLDPGKNYENLRPGDLVFWARAKDGNERYMQISHVAVYAYPEDLQYTTWAIGGLVLDTGSFSSSNTTRGRTDYIKIPDYQLGEERSLYLWLNDPEWCFISIALHKTQGINANYLGTSNTVSGESVQYKFGCVKITIPEECAYIRCYIAHRVDGVDMEVKQADLATLTMGYSTPAHFGKTYEATTLTPPIVHRTLVENQPDKIVLCARPRLS